MIKLIASDLDGTLIGDDFRFRPRTLQALHAAADAGVRVIFVTGRPLRWMAPVLEQLGKEWNGENSFAFCSNGAVTYDIARDKVVATRTITGAQVLAMNTDIQAAYPSDRHPDTSFIAETIDHVYVQGSYRPHIDEDTSKVSYGTLDDLLAPDAQIVKYLVRVGGQDPTDFLNRVRDLVGERGSATRSVPYQPLVEIAQRGMNKGTVLADFAAEHGISAHEVAAFGDMPNDFEMLNWAKHGYVMDSGLPELKDRVGRTCPSFDEDGVAQTIENLLTGR